MFSFLDALRKSWDLICVFSEVASSVVASSVVASSVVASVDVLEIRLVFDRVLLLMPVFVLLSAPSWVLLFTV